MFEKRGGLVEFKIESNFKPTGDQPQAIEQIVNSINNNNKFTSLLGVTGSGKTFTMANVIEKVQKPTLIMAHNKTLAAQLYSEFKDFFPNNAVEYFVSYYNHYQPEAYVAHTDTYIEKDASVNDEIDKLRHSATAAILERKDVIIISSVSCIYGLGDPKDYKELMISLRPGMQRDRDVVIKELVSIQYERNDINFERGTFRVRGDIIEIMPANSDDTGIRIEFFGDEIDRITEINYITGEIIGSRNHIAIFPASHYVTNSERLEKALQNIEEELNDRVKYFKENEKLLEAQRIEQRTNYDIEMLKEIGFCQGIENYSRHITGRKEGDKPYTLMDFFPDDYLIIVDESHVTVPQVRGMYGGDRSRKESLIENGFRLPSAYDNRPLNFSEFEENINQMLFVSATPGPYEIQNSNEFAEQIIRPTGLLDPEIDVRPINNQIDNLLSEINDIVSKKERVLVTTLTKRMSEDLTDYLKNAGIKVKYLHSDIETLERTEIIRDLRIGKFDVLVGINLLREGLDIPEVSLVAILDADKEGFLRSETSLIQTVGRAARNKNGRVIMYADKITRSMESAINETNRRREIQQKYNEENNIIPQSINKDIKDVIEATQVADEEVAYGISSNIDKDELKENINRLKDEMMEAAKNLQFERAANLRDKIAELEERIEK
ncbi:excinuclease ABC subunit UvrB [Tepidibacter aestuarii]|uniref:excinuclease ABC subunit UvrB n=1 Tax=Tepidibacter aestuarii TaxID=2925782 RepID=UPI0020BE6A4C|nr:excinuclease ABC subunit UvrB [Tepidibacter aestuarii]